VLSKTVRLTAADLLALNVTPFQLVAAPGAGNIVAVIGVAFVYNFGAHPYQDTLFNGLDVKYAGSLVQLVSVIPQTTLIEHSQSAFAYSGSLMTTLVNILPGADNKAVQLSGGDFHGGPIVTSTLGAGGAGYAANDTGTITSGNGDATYRVLTVDGGGAVLTFSITAPGTGYTVGNSQATAPGGAQPGVGAGFTVNITAVQNGDGTLKVVTFYQIIPLP
jgi:hypothetical protein